MVIVGLMGQGIHVNMYAKEEGEVKKEVMLAVRVPEDMRRAIKAMAAQEGTTVQILVREAISDLLKHHKSGGNNGG